MSAHHLTAVLETEPHWASDDDQARFWILEGFNGGRAWVGWFRGTSAWTRHPDGDALIQNLRGQSEIELRLDTGREMHPIPEGGVFVVPRGVWHRYTSVDGVSQFGAYPGAVEHEEA